VHILILTMGTLVDAAAAAAAELGSQEGMGTKTSVSGADLPQF